MSGHSKWSTIKRKKGAADQKRGKEFSKLIRVITQAAKEGGGDPEQNAQLRSVLDKAKSINMPKDTIQNAIKRGTGEIEGADYIELTYEGYGPGGIAFVVETVTDNKNRTTADIRYVLSRHGGTLGESNCVQWMFDRVGLVLVPSEGIDEDDIMEVGIEAGAEEVVEDGGFYRITCSPQDFENLKKAIADAGYTIDTAELSMEPQTTVEVDEKKVGSVLKLIGLLEELDDVQNVYSNFDISDEILEKLAAE